jgi:hypothetical protein
MAEVTIIPGTGPALQNNADASLATNNLPTPASDSNITAKGTPAGNTSGAAPVFTPNPQAPLNVDPGDAGGGS